MKKTVSLLNSLIIAAFISSCTSKDVNDENKIPSKINIYPELQSSKVTSTSFDINDTIGLEIVIEGESDAYLNNVALSYDGQYFTNGDIKWYSDSSRPSTLIAYYPYSESGIPYNFTVSCNQTAGTADSDLLGSIRTDVIPSKDAVTMKFRHLLSKIAVTVENNSQNAVKSVTIQNLKTKAAIDYYELRSLADPSYEPVAVIAHKVSNNNFEMIVPEQEGSFRVVLGMEDETELSEVYSAKMLSGRIHPLNISVQETSIHIEVAGDIQDWEGGEDFVQAPEEDNNYGSFTKQENSVKTFLLANLESGTGRYRADAILTRDSIEMARSLVWKAWKKANMSFDEEKLPGLPQFGDQSADLFTWNIPKSLEGEYLGNGQYSGKDAQMIFHWGSCGSKAEGGYPVFVYLHGSGSVSSEWPNGYGFCKKWGQSTAGIYFVPKIPNGVTEPGFSLYRWWQKGKQYIWNRLIRQLFISSYADPDRFFFVGISEGAYGSARLSTFYADYLAGIGPIAGGEPLNTAPVENSANIAYCLRTGSEDAGYGRNTITKYTGEALDALEKAHPGYYDHWVYLEPGAYHGTVDYDQAVPWLNGKVRKHYPKYVNWERLDQDGIYREGFYNLFIPDGGHPSDRRQYEMTISGNVVNIKVGTVSYTGIEWDEKYGNCVNYQRNYTTVSGGKIRIYLCDELLDLDQPVVVKVNGNEVFSGMLERKFEDMVNSCAIYFDRSRLYTASVEVEY